MKYIKEHFCFEIYQIDDRNALKKITQFQVNQKHYRSQQPLSTKLQRYWKPSTKSTGDGEGRFRDGNGEGQFSDDHGLIDDEDEDKAKTNGINRKKEPNLQARGIATVIAG